MSKVSIWLAAMTIGIVTCGLSGSVLAQPESPESLICPEGYTQVGWLCINRDGDVVEPK